jgi:hypothetical protein
MSDPTPQHKHIEQPLYTPANDDERILLTCDGRGVAKKWEALERLRAADRAEVSRLREQLQQAQQRIAMLNKTAIQNMGSTPCSGVPRLGEE